MKGVALSLLLILLPCCGDEPPAPPSRDATHPPFPETTRTWIGMNDDMHVIMILKANKTFRISGHSESTKKLNSSQGHWRLQKGVLTLTATHRDGEALRKPEITTALVKEGRIHLGRDNPLVLHEQ